MPKNAAPSRILPRSVLLFELEEISSRAKPVVNRCRTYIKAYESTYGTDQTPIPVLAIKSHLIYINQSLIERRRFALEALSPEIRLALISGKRTFKPIPPTVDWPEMSLDRYLIRVNNLVKDYINDLIDARRAIFSRADLSAPENRALL